ncbi:putative SOS response-associated peptidase YedK [Blastomonas natatoria]|uniref:Abasic site processing protein n=1 Tax=Blastomonas natatoria TaxID=34015 RepID=A0A2V3UQ52_9SPHN|nr:SOS response-associated peptidase family protein [Blastomonas natatoria]PXW69502.1 putative SOS response-associated peptidase YedK [Blastomonas natatoria]
MCNLYRMTSNADAIRQLFGAVLGEVDLGGANLPPFEGIYPDYEAPVLVAEGQGARLATMRWGWPPFGDIRRPITNVRNLSSPMWRSALRVPARRCLVPVTAFCEYAAAPDPVTKRKRQHWFALTSGEPFAFAGIWRPVEMGARFAFLTCAPNALVGAVHPKAMPVMLTGERLAQWLREDWGQAERLVAPYPDATMIELPEAAPHDASGPQPGLFG